MKLKEVIISIVLIVFLILVDQLSKYFAFKLLELKSYKCIPHVIRFDLLYNKGAMFGILQGKTTLFFIITVLGLSAFGYMLFKYGNFKLNPFYTIGLVLMIGGTIGNFIDRFLSMFESTHIYGVRDFITFDFFNFASFNFADMCMCVGVVMLAIDLLFGSVGEKWK